MTLFEQFQTNFFEIYKDVNTFMFEFYEERESLQIELTLEEDITIRDRDDSGNKNDRLEKIFYSHIYGMYIRFTGTDCSYAGVEWNNKITQVLPKQKTITIYEEVS